MLSMASGCGNVEHRLPATRNLQSREERDENIDGEALVHNYQGPRAKNSRSTQGEKCSKMVAPLLGIFPKEMKAGTERDFCSPMLKAALFTTAKRWLKQASVHGRVNG